MNKKRRKFFQSYPYTVEVPLLNFWGYSDITLSKLKATPIKFPWGEVKSLWHDHYIWPSREGGDMWKDWEWMAGEGGWVNSRQVRHRELGSNEQVDFHRRWGILRGKLCFKLEITVWPGTPLSCWSEIVGSILTPWKWSDNGPVPNSSIPLLSPCLSAFL